MRTTWHCLMLRCRAGQRALAPYSAGAASYPAREGTPPSPPSLDKVSVRVGRLPHVLAVRVTFLRFQILGRDPRCDSRSLPFSVTLTTDEVVHGPRCIGTCG